MDALAIKTVTSNLLSCCGLLSVMEQIKLTGRAPVFMYHRVLSDKTSQACHVQPGMYVSNASFDRQVNFLRERFEIVSLEELLERDLAGKKLTGLCALTFDDGWRDNFSEAFPILQYYNVPATIFLATGFISTEKLFWPEEFCRCLELVEPQQLIDQDDFPFLALLGKTLANLKPGDRDAFFDDSIAIVKQISPQVRRKLLAHLVGLAPCNPVQRQMLSWEEVRTMEASGLVHFGSHTVNHELLTQLEPDKAREEIAHSCAAIMDELGSPVRLFAYPNGNSNAWIRNVLGELGLRGAVTTRRGLMGADMSSFDIPRIAMHEDVGRTIPLFRSRMLMSLF